MCMHLEGSLLSARRMRKRFEATRSAALDGPNRKKARRPCQSEGPLGGIGRAKLQSWRQFSPSNASNFQSIKSSAPQLEIPRLKAVIFNWKGRSYYISRRESTTDEISKALVEAKTTLATKSYDFDEARLRARSAKAALEASLAAFDALAAENDRLRASRHHHSK